MKPRLLALFGRITRAAEACKSAPIDHELLDRFVQLRDEEAFEELLRRYGPMVMSVCRGTLFDRHQAEDAFQATFLTLISNAGSIRRSHALGTWLHRVALRVCFNLQRSARRERARQEHGARAEAVPPTELARDDMEAAVNEELNRLPERYRQAIVLCCLLGKTYSQASAELGVTPNAVWERVSRGREMLRTRLGRRGLAVASGLLLAAPAIEGVSSACSNSMTQMAIAAAAGRTAEVPSHLLELARLAAPTNLKLKIWLAMAVVAVFTGVVAGVGAFDSAKPVPQQPAVSKAKTIDSNTPNAIPSTPVAVLAGVVANDAGQPVPFARVIALAKQRERGEGGAGDRVIAEVHADSNGRYSLPVPPFTTPLLEDRRVKLFATAPSGAAIGVREVALPPGHTPEAINLAVPTARDVRGVVTNLRGDPVAGATVSVLGMGDSTISLTVGEPVSFPTANWPKPVRTDARGEFTIPAVGSIALKLAVEHDVHAYTEVRIFDTRNAEAQLIRLGPPRRLEGCVLTADTGEPVPHARVLVSGLRADGMVGRNIRADVEGRFSVNLPDDRVIRIQAHGADETPYLSILQGIDWPADPSDTKREVKLILPRGLLARGRVLEEETGRPIAGAHVQFYPRRKNNPHHRSEVMLGGAAVVTTNADGCFALPILPGPGTLMVSGPSFEYLPRETDLGTLENGELGGRYVYPHAILALDTNPHSEPPVSTIALRRGAVIEGRVLVPDGKPLTDGRLVCRHLVTPRELSAPIPIHVIDGRFRLPGCASGRQYFAMIYDAEKRWGTLAELCVPKQRDETVEVRLQPTGQAKLRFVERDGDPVIGANPNLVLMLPPDLSTNDSESRKARLRRSEPLPVRWYQSAVRGNGPLTDSEGEVLLTGLIPGVNYRVGKVTGAVWRPLLELQPKAGETLNLPAVVVDNDDGR